MCGVSIRVLVVERLDVEVFGCWVICSSAEAEDVDEVEEVDAVEVVWCREVDGESLVYFLRKPMVRRSERQRAGFSCWRCLLQLFLTAQEWFRLPTKSHSWISCAMSRPLRSFCVDSRFPVAYSVTRRNALQERPRRWVSVLIWAE